MQTFIESDRHLEVIGTAKEGKQALSIIQRLNPDVALIDIEMPGELNGLDVCKIVSQSFRQRQKEQKPLTQLKEKNMHWKSSD